jgi:Tol biopolymer transport system component
MPRLAARAVTSRTRPLLASGAVIAALLATVAVAAAGAVSSHALNQSSRRNGLIVFMRPGTVGEFDLWVTRPDGTHLRRLTRSPKDRSDYHPDWSPDGSTVLFERRVLTNGTDGDDLYTVKADGSDLRQITTCADDCWFENEARWSPDGSQIAFNKGSGPRTIDHPSTIAINLMSADGTGTRQVSTPPAGYEDHYPTWSPDGKTIVFQRDTNANPPGPTELRAVDLASGSERHLYTLPRFASGAGIANFAPDGSRVLFSFWCIYGDGCAPDSRGPRNARLATINADGTGLAVLRLKALGDSGAWSPDGKKVVFRCQPKSGAAIGNFRICTSKVDGTGLKRFPWRVDSAHPDWGTHP